MKRVRKVRSGLVAVVAFYAVTVAGLVAPRAFAQDEGDANFNVMKARQARLHGNAPLVINGTNVTASAAELNILDGCTATYSQLNAAAGGSSATLTPTLVSNSTLKVYGQKVEVVSGGSLTIPVGAITDASITNADLSTDSVGKGNLVASDFGDFTAGADGTCTIDNNAVTADKIGTANFLVALSNACVIVDIGGTNYYLKIAP